MVRRLRIPGIGVGPGSIQPRNNNRRVRLVGNIGQTNVPLQNYTNPRQQGDLRGSGILPPELERQNILGNIGQSDVPLARFAFPRIAPGDIPVPEIQDQPFDVVRSGQASRSQPTSQTDKKRRIKVSKNSLDPISSLLFSRAKNPDVDGYIYENPLSNNNQIRANYSDRENRTNPDFIWSLGGMTPGNPPPETVNTEFLGQFLDCINPSISRVETVNNEALFLEGNPYVYLDKELSSTGQIAYRNMPSEILGKTLETADRVLSVFEGPEGQESQLGRAIAELEVRFLVLEPNRDRLFIQFDSEEDPEVGFFFDYIDRFIREGASPIMRAYQRDVRALREEINQRVQDGLVNVNLFEIIVELLRRVSLDADASREGRVLRFLIAQAIIPIVGLPLYLTATQSFEDDYEYVSKYIEIDTPYVTNRDTSNFLRDVQQPNYVSTIKPSYNYYAKNYELAFNLGITEDVLTNIYAKQQYDDLNFRLNRGPTDQFKFEELGTILSLGSSIAPLDSLSSYPREIFYNLYGLGLLDTEDESLAAFKDKNRSVIIGGDSITNNQVFYNPPPMSIDVQFTRSDENNFLSLVNNLGLADPSSIIFENIQYPSEISQGGLETRGSYYYSTEYIYNAESSVEYETQFVETSLIDYNLNNLLFPRYDQARSVINNNVHFNSLVVSENDGITSADDLDILVSSFFGKAVSASKNNYLNVLQGENTQNFSIGYRISKMKGGQRIQDFYIGNGSDLESRTISYVDSQVKYGDEYDYDLYDYRLTYGTKYKFASLSPETPLWVFEYYLGIISEIPANLLAQSPNIVFNCYVESEIDYSVIEVPVYSTQFIEDNFANIPGFESLTDKSSGIVYPTAKVLDRPPTAPILNIYPLVNIEDQVKIVADLQTGENIGDQALEIVSIGDVDEKILELKEYQDEFTNAFLPPGVLEFKNEGLTEIRNLTLYRATDINLDVETYNEIYSSFNPLNNDSVIVRRYTDRADIQSPGAEFILSYAILDQIQPNQNYYYTCIVEDVHGNPSNPSIIYRVRLLLEKGLLIPEIDTVSPSQVSPTKPQKDLTRFLQISPSTIQSEPFLRQTNDGEVTERSIGAALDKSIEDQSYIVRLTSKDTGRKFDVKLNFVVRVDGAPINEGT